MRSSIHFSAAVILATLPLASCQSTAPVAADQELVVIDPAQGLTVTMVVKGMTCPFCASGLENYLADIDGVEQVEAQLGSGRVILRMTSIGDTTEAELRQAVNESGFTVDGFESEGPSQ